MLNTIMESGGVCFLEQITEQNRIESSLNLSDSYFSKILSSSCQIVDEYCKVVNGELKYGGKITYNVIYEGEGIERIEAGAEFSFKKIIGVDNAICTPRYQINSHQIKRSGGLLYVETIIDSSFDLFTQKEVNYLADIDCLKQPDMVNFNRIESYEELFSLDDEFECAKLKNLLSSTTGVSINSISPIFDGVKIQGDLILTLVLLPFGQNSDILKERRVIPFDLQFDLPGVREDSKLLASALATKISCKVMTDEDENLSTISTQIDLRFNFQAEILEEKALLKDVFSTTANIDKTIERIEYFQFVGQKIQTEKISGKFICSVPENSRFICLGGEEIQVVSTYEKNGENLCDLLALADAIFIDGENQMVSRKAQFAFTVKLGEKALLVSLLDATVCELSSKLKQGQIEGELTVKISFMEFDKISFSVITGVSEISQKSPNKSAISVYIGKKGDSEWNVMTNLGEEIDVIYQFNPTLEFPLSGGEKVICYRQIK